MGELAISSIRCDRHDNVDDAETAYLDEVKALSADWDDRDRDILDNIAAEGS
jgi:hypothetical protein